MPVIIVPIVTEKVEVGIDKALFILVRDLST